MQSQTYFRPFIHLFLDDNEFSFITEALKENAETASFAMLGNTWYGAINSRPYYDDPKDAYIELTTRELDTKVLKALEHYKMFPAETEERKFGRKLFYDLFKILEATHREAEEVNKNYKIKAWKIKNQYTNFSG